MSHTLLVFFTSASLGVTALVYYLSTAKRDDAPASAKRPVLLVSSTFHSRFKPVLHSFRYPVLYVGLDLDCADHYVDALFSASEATWRPLNLRRDDYLGHKHTGTIKEKLWAHLKDRSIDTTNLARAFLVTTPRLLGYAFNPVSFHYIYDVEGTLKVVVLEVNNTFGEKHIYVLEQDLARDRVRSGYTSAQTFPRRFHVSPFNDRSGSYQLQCLDPLMDETCRVDMHLTLLESDGTKKLTAQVNSIRPAVPTHQTPSCSLGLLRHGAGVFLTMPRILIEAYRLHYGKALAVYLRPEPYEDQGAIGRGRLSSTDRFFMDLVMAYLSANAEWLPCKEVRFDVLPACQDGPLTLRGGWTQGETLHMTILSYRFFTSLVTSESPLTTLWTDSLAVPSSPLFRVSDPLLFLRVFTAGFSRPLDGRHYLTRYRSSYRGQPAWFAQQLPSIDKSHVQFLNQTNGGFDNYVYDMAAASKRSLWQYRFRVLMALITEWAGNAAFGALATFAGDAGRPADEWLRVKLAFERRKKGLPEVHG